MPDHEQNNVQDSHQPRLLIANQIPFTCSFPYHLEILH